MPVCTWVDGEYGIAGVYLGVEAELGAGGVRRVVERDLSDAERAGLEAAAEAVPREASRRPRACRPEGDGSEALRGLGTARRVVALARRDGLRIGVAPAAVHEDPPLGGPSVAKLLGAASTVEAFGLADGSRGTGFGLLRGSLSVRAGAVFDDLGHRRYVVRGEVRLHLAADIEDDRSVLSRPGGVKAGPVPRVRCAPDAALAADRAKAHCLRPAYRRVRDSLGTPQVVPADHDRVVVAGDPPIVVKIQS